jgi:hypothetical protein
VRLLPLLPLLLAVAVGSIPLLGQFLPLPWRELAMERRSRTYCSAICQVLFGLFFCLSKGTEVMSGHEVSLYNLFFIAIGGVLIGIGVSQALAATRLSLLLGERWTG